MRSALRVFGCCGRWRGTVLINLGNARGLITIEAFGPSAETARAAVLELVREISVPGFDPADIQERVSG